MLKYAGYNTDFMNVNCFKRGENGQMGCGFNNVSCQIVFIGPLTDVDAKCLVIASDAIASPHCGEEVTLRFVMLYTSFTVLAFRAFILFSH